MLTGTMRRRIVPDSDTMEPQQPRQPMKNSEANIKGVEGCCCYEHGESAPPGFFERACKAIEDGKISKLKQAIQEMKEAKGGSSALLDTCRLIEKSGVAYSMSLLALCGFHERKDMVDLLLMEGAGMKADSSCKLHGPGTPILQMMVHCLIQDKCDQLRVTMLEYFIQKGADLHGNVAARHFGLSHNDTGGVKYGVLDLPLSMQRVDCAKVLVEEGVDVLSGGCPRWEMFDVVPMFQEYRDHGTNEFICWAFKEYIPKHPEFDLKQIIQSIINMKKKDEKSRLWQSVRRTPAHAILTSQHEETIKRLIEHAKKEFDLDLLAEQSCTGKTALHVAAENGDVKSIHILLQLGADSEVSDNSDVSPFMLAVKKGHAEVVKAMMEGKPELVSSKLGSGSTVIHWALEECRCSAFFKCCFEKYPEVLLAARDSQGNTIAHLVAASGNTEVFEILWSEEFTEAFFSDQNLEGKTPLQLAVDNGSFNVLKTFETRIYGERECTTPRWHHNLKNEWWNKIVPYVLYASACGSLRAVKYFIACGQEPTISHNGKTALLCAAEAGHNEIVAYLLEFTKVRTDLEKETKEMAKNASASPLLMAAQNGHPMCVTHLLQNGANVLQTDLKNRNCLMIAIQNHHRKTALAILSDKNGMEALKRGENPTPLQLLVKEMPDLAEYVLNKCITQDEKQISIGNFSCSNPTVTPDEPVYYNFDFLVEDNQILDWMVEHDRLELLQHPLVDNFLSQKFWSMAFPLFLLNMLFYCSLLVALNLFAMLIPRPGPDSETCPESGVVNVNISKCHDQNGSDWSFLDILAILLHDLSLLGILMAAWQLLKRGWRYFKDSDNYFQLALYISTVIFVRGFDNECWCSTSSQWQIGALAVFLSWLNFIFILRYLSYTAVPINMFFSICVTFLKLIFVPIVLILAFGVPNYMVFVRTASSSEKVGNLTAFRSPGHAVAKTLLQLVGEFDYEATFNQGALLYSPATYILFIAFLITMPLLFTNLLTGLAVGDTQKHRDKAEITKLKVWVEFIMERERSRGITHTRCKAVYYAKKNESKEDFGNDFVVTLFHKNFRPASCFINFFLKCFESDYTYHAELAKELKGRNDEIHRTVMARNQVDDVREDIKESFGNLKLEMMAHKTHDNAIEDVTEVNKDTKQEMMAHKPDDTVREDVTELNEDTKEEMMLQAPQLVDTVREDITELKKDISSLKEEMMALDVREDMRKLREDINNLKQEMTSLLQALGSKIEKTSSFTH